MYPSSVENLGAANTGNISGYGSTLVIRSRIIFRQPGNLRILEILEMSKIQTRRSYCRYSK